MAGRTFFDIHFIGMSITFGSATWTEIVDFDEGTCWKHPSYSYLLRPRIISLSRIHVQIPYAGSESELPEERARQASEEVNWLNKSENSRLPTVANTCQPCSASGKEGRRPLDCFQVATSLTSWWPLSQEFALGPMLKRIPSSGLCPVRNMMRLKLRTGESLMVYHINRQPNSIKCVYVFGTNRDVLTIGILTEFPGLKGETVERNVVPPFFLIILRYPIALI